MIITNASDVDFGVKDDPIPSHVFGEIVTYQMLYVVDSDMGHNFLIITI
jgi:hypothetical protein